MVKVHTLQRLPRRFLSLLSSLAMVFAIVPAVTLLTAIPANAAANPVQINTTLEGCKRPAPAAKCTYPTTFTPGDLGKNWAELDFVPHRLTLKNNSGADETFSIELAADNELGGKLGYDLIKQGWDTTFNTAAAPMFSADCGSPSVTEENNHEDGIVGGVDTTLTDKLTITMAANATCLVSFEVRLGIGSHLYTGSSLQTQVLNGDDSSFGQRTVSIPVKEIAPQVATTTASASQNTNFTWSATKTPNPDSIDVNSCLPAPTEPNVSFHVTWTRTEHAAGGLTVTGTINLTNPSVRALTTDSITDTVHNAAGAGSDIAAVVADQHVTVPGATVSGPGTASTTFSADIPAPVGALTNSATVIYQDPDQPGQVLPGLTTSSTAVTVDVTQTQTNENADLSDSESFTSGSGLVYKRTAPAGHTTSGFVSSDTFTENGLSDSGSYDISKIVWSNTPENLDGTLHDAVSLTPNDGGPEADAHADVTIHVTAADPTITLAKSVDIAPTDAAGATFTFSITNNDTSTTYPDVHITIPQGQTSASSDPITVDPSDLGYSIDETPAPGYSAVSTSIAGPVGLCDTVTKPISDTRDLGHVTVVKVLDGPVADANDTFTFNVDCGQVYSTTLQVTGNGSASTDDVIPTGTPCTITEQTPPAGWTETNSDPSDGQVSAEQGSVGNTVTITNTRDLGKIVVNKTMVGDPAGASDVFHFSWSCASNDDTFSDSGTFDITGSGSHEVTGIPTGVSCTVTETDLDSHWTLTSESPQDGTAVSSADGGTVDFTNTRNVGHITVEKNLDGDIAGALTTFEFDIECPSIDFSQTLTIDASSGSGSQSSDDIPTGVACTVTETLIPQGWQLESVTPHSEQDVTVGSVVVADGDNTVTFVNQRLTGVITVTKTREGNVAGASTVFTFDITCADFPQYDQQLTIDTADSATATATSTAIPTGVECVVTEESTAGWQQTVPVEGGVDVTVPGDASFTNTRLTGQLQLAKAVTPATGSYDPNSPNNTLNYTLTMTATGQLDHTNVVVTDYIPGYDPADTTSGKTTYVTGSATCSTGCTATYDASKHLLTWDVGNYNHDDAALVLTFKVTIDQPTPGANGAIPAERIDNVGFVESLQQPKTPSNQVVTPVLAVLGVKVVKKPPQVLPFTGAVLPVRAAGIVGLLLIAVGGALTATRRRRRGEM